MVEADSIVAWYESLGKALKQVQVKVGENNAELKAGLDQTVALLQSTRKSGAYAWWVGNGGSAAICSHLAQDMMNKLDMKSVYQGDSSLMTCMANDFGYENVYAKPLEKLADKGDLLIAISSSGNSANILNCVDMARSKGMKIITLSGFDPENRLWNRKTDVSFFIASNLYGIVEMSHEAILHGIIETMWLDARR